MTTQKTSDLFARPRGFARKIRRALSLSSLALWAEALSAALWPVFSVLCLAAAAAVLGLFDALGPWGHWAALAGVAAAALAAFVWGVGSVRLPDRGSALRRLDASRPERPLSVLTDRLAPTAASNDVARALWVEHQRRAEAAAGGLSVRAPDLRLARRDRWALRLAAPVLLAGALLGAGGSAPDRLAAALAPGGAGTDSLAGLAAEPAVEAWAVPPAYTRAETVYLNRVDTAQAPLSLPQGTEITIRATGMAEAPAVELALLDVGGGTGAPGFVSLGGGLHEATGVLARSGRLAIGPAEAPMAAWEITMIPDAAPEIELADLPRAGANRALELGFTARDDHGVVAAWAVISLPDPAVERAEIPPIEFGLPLPISGDATEVTDRAIEDLTEHPWAGAEVEIVLHAEDGAGQKAETAPHRFRLPERRFTDPLARALAEQRRELLLDYGGAARVLDSVQSVTRLPEEVFDNHAGAYVAVRLALRRLAPAIVEEQVSGVAGDVAEFLWRAALSLESGDLASALERLREAEERLRSALESGTEQEIAEAIEELRQAMADYLEEMARQALENPDMLPQADQNSMPLTQQNMEEMLRQLQEMAESGLRDQARDMLSQLSQMLENLRMGQMQPGQSPGQQALQRLQELIQRQQGLADETFNALRQQRRQEGQQGQGQQPGQPGQPGQGQEGQGQAQGGQGSGGERSGQHSENGRLSAEQEALRRAIEELAGQLGGGEGMDGASRALDQAGEQMGAARDDLSRGDTAPAVQDQLDALDSLNGAANALADALAQQGQGDTAASGEQMGEGDMRDRQPIDPFDRPSGNGRGYESDLYGGVPNQALIDRARELLDELRRRSSDRTRPELELEYLERLLEQF